MGLNEKILLFDRIVHTEHAAGAFREFLPEERSIFGVDIGKIHAEADREIEKIIRGEKPVPDPPTDRKSMEILATASILAVAGIIVAMLEE